MAKRETVLITCDMCVDDEEATAVPYVWDGVSWTIDLCAEHRKNLEEALVPYIDASRRPTGTRAARKPRGTGPGPRGGTTGPNEEVTVGGKTNAEVRQWLKENGFKVGDKGRFSADLRAQYTHGTGDKFIKDLD